MLGAALIELPKILLERGGLPAGVVEKLVRCEGGGPAGVVEGACEKREFLLLRLGVAGELETKLKLKDIFAAAKGRERMACDRCMLSSESAK